MRLVMMGTGLFAEPTFEALLKGPEPVVGLFTQPDRAAGQERGSTRQVGKGLKAIALERNVPVFQPDSVNTYDSLALLQSLRPDLLVVAAYGQILKPEIFGAATHGAVNVHASLLPAYRGAAPIAWAIYHGEARTGVTLFRIAKGVDTGVILAQEAIDIGPDETAGDVEARLAPIGARLAAEVVARFARGDDMAGLPQDNARASRAPKLTKEDGLIDWSRRAEKVVCQVRAMHPWPTAYTFWRRAGQPALRLIVHKARARQAASGEALAPGEIAVGQLAALTVGAGEGTVVEVHELQPAGKPRLAARDFLNGRRPQPGDRLGPEAP